MKFDVNSIYNEDCLNGMSSISDGSIDCILTDPPYLYLKNEKLDRPFDEQAFFTEAKRVLKKDGFIVLFGRGTSFYRWNCILADLEFTFKEEIIWNKAYCTSPLMAISRVHETISIHTKGKGTINKVKVPYLEMKMNDIGSIVTDIKRLKTTFKNTNSLDAVLSFIENNKIEYSESIVKNRISDSGHYESQNRSTAVFKQIQKGMNKKKIIRSDYEHSDSFARHEIVGDKNRKTGDRATDVIQSISFGQNEKSIIRQAREHYSTIHPTQKPPRLLERLLALVTKEGDLVLDPFSGSGSTAIAAYNTFRQFIACEIDKEYFDASVQRLSKITCQTRMNFF